MHFTSLCNTAIDRPASVASSLSDEVLLEYLHTDTVCCRTPLPPSFVELQNVEWGPVCNWWQQHMGAQLSVFLPYALVWQWNSS